MAIYLFSDDRYFCGGVKALAEASFQNVITRRWDGWGPQFILSELRLGDLLLLDATCSDFICKSLCFPLNQMLAKVCIVEDPDKAALPIFSRWSRIPKNITPQALPGLLILMQTQIRPGSYSPGRLTERESQVVGRLYASRTHYQIARELNISVKTISTHKINIMKKMGVMSFHELLS